ncbi:MAG: MFS transporter [Tissierellia bacterium]|jgi:predicted MFS family arabinose efflux permease|nr:MFS transporter [Tissierellia bacterium]
MNTFLMFLTTFIIQFIIAMEMNLIGPLAPYLAQYFNIRDSSVMLFNLGYSAVGIFVPLLGVMADRHGKKRLLSFALVVYIVGTILAGMANSPILFAFGRIFIGLGYFSLSGTNLSYISEFVTYENRGKASGILRIAFGLAIIIGPLYATRMIQIFNNIAAIYFPLGILGLIALLMLFKLPETSKSSNVKLDKNEIFHIIKEPESFKIFLSILLLLAAPSLLLGYFGIYLSNSFNLTQEKIGIVYTVLALGSTSGIIFSTIFSDKIGKLKLAKIFFLILVFSQLAVPYLGNIYIAVGLAALFTFGLDGGWTAYQTYGSEMKIEQRGTFMSIFYTINALAVTVYSILGPLIFSAGGFKLAVAVGSISSALALVVIFKMDVNHIQ